MFGFNLVCTALFAILNLAVGVRLLVLGARTRGIPEFSLGFAFLLSLGIAYPISWSIHIHQITPDSAQAWLSPIWRIASSAGSTALLFFVWKVFRADQWWAAGVFGACTLLLVGSFIAQELTGGYHDPTGPAWQIPFLIATAAYVWAAGESFRYYRVMTARIKLGLGDPLLARRFLLWSLGCAAITPPLFLQITMQLVYDRVTFDARSPFTSLSAASLVLAGTLVLRAFTTPKGAGEAPSPASS